MLPHVEVQNETNKDGGGKGQWSAWKVRALKAIKYYIMAISFCLLVFGGLLLRYKTITGTKNVQRV